MRARVALAERGGAGHHVCHKFEHAPTRILDNAALGVEGTWSSALTLVSSAVYWCHHTLMLLRSFPPAPRHAIQRLR